MKFLRFYIYYLLLANLSYAQSTSQLDSSSDSSNIILVYLKTGEVLEGSMISEDKDFLKIQLLDSQLHLIIPIERIEKIAVRPSILNDTIAKEAKEMDAFPATPPRINSYQNNGQYILTTSGFNIEKGRWILKNNPTTFQYGVRNDLSIGIGSIFSALFAGSFSLYLNSKFSYKINGLLRLKVGVDALGVISAGYPDAEAGVLFNGGVTVGIPTANFTAASYYGRLSDLGDTGFLYSIAGKLAVSPSVSIITENFIVPIATLERESITYLSIMAVRLHRQEFSLDLGYLANRAISEFLPVFGIPFVAFSIAIN